MFRRRVRHTRFRKNIGLCLARENNSKASIWLQTPEVRSHSAPFPYIRSSLQLHTWEENKEEDGAPVASFHGTHEFPGRNYPDHVSKPPAYGLVSTQTFHPSPDNPNEMTQHTISIEPHLVPAIKFFLANFRGMAPYLQEIQRFLARLRKKALAKAQKNDESEVTPNPD